MGSILMVKLLFILMFLIGCDTPTESNEDIGFSGITETDSSGALIGNVDSEDWCSFDMNSIDSGFGLNPVYPNPVSAQDWGLFGNSYQICYQYSTPHDSTWSNFNSISINIVGANQDTLHTLNDDYANGQVGVCAYIADSLITEPIYRMYIISNDWECTGDIQFNE